MIEVVVIGADEWKEKYSEQAHLIAFGKAKPASWDRIDYALLLVDRDANAPSGYITCREFDHETIYWQFGGSMPGTKNTPKSLACFDAALEWAKAAYRRITFVVENTNLPMLKLAMKREFQIVGVRNFHGSILLEHMKEFA